MVGDGRGSGMPSSAVVVGAGIVGLSVAWFLQERGVAVTVVDRTGVGAGASWGNAGWVAPGLAIPLNEPTVLRYGLRSLLDPGAPLHVPLRSGPGLWWFLARFAANCRWSSWGRAVRGNLPLSEEAVEAYDVLTSNGVAAPTRAAPVTAAFSNTRQRDGLLRELARMAEAGQSVEHRVLSADELYEHAPLASPNLTSGVRVDGQRHLDPGEFVQALGNAVVSRGAELRLFEVGDIRIQGRGVTVRQGDDDGEQITADVAVLATGAWLPRLAKSFGVRVPVRAGRGYSFIVPVDRPVPGPIYLPGVRVACTPYRDRLLVAGTMEFSTPEAPPEPARPKAIIDSTQRLLHGVRWDERRDVWVGSRPVTHDGRPLVGPVHEPKVYLAGGHGMWGLTHGPATGRLLAEQIVTGKQPDALRELHPLR